MSLQNLLVSFLAIAVISVMQPPKSTLVYIGTYTNTTSKGIYVSRLDLAQGTLTAPVLAAESENPSFLGVHPTRDWLYAVNEIGTYEGKPSGSVSAFAINRDSGALTPINRQPSVGGGPAHLTVDNGGKNVLVANYGGGSVAVLPVGADGALKPASAFVQHTGSSVNPARQKSPHAHSVIVDKTDRFAYVADLGVDKIMIYQLDAAKGALVIRAFVRKKKSTSSMIANDIDADVSQKAVQSRVIVPSAAVFEK